MGVVADTLRPSIVIALLVVGMLGQSSGAATASGVDPVPFGRPFPAATFDNLNVEAGGPPEVDLGTVLGKKPIVLFYWIAGNPRADGLFVELQELVNELGPDKLALYGVVLQRPGREADVIKAKARELKIQVPVLDDEGFGIGQQLRVQSVPNITIIDAEGNLRLSNGALLTQDVEYNMTVETTIRRDSLSLPGCVSRN